MLRRFVAAGVALLVLVGAALAQKESFNQVRGSIKKVDADKGVLTLTVGKGDNAKDVDYKISEQTKIIGGDRKELTDGLKGLKAGTAVTLFKDKDDKVVGVLVGGPDKVGFTPPGIVPTAGKVKKVDADKGILTVTVGKGDQAKDVDFKITAATKLMVTVGQPLEGGLKSKELKEGAAVTIYADPEGKVMALLLAGKGPAGGPLTMTPTAGKIKKVDADKGILTVTVGTGGQAKDVDYKIADDTHIATASGKPLKGGLKDERVKVGSTVTLFVTHEGKVIGLLLGQPGGGSTTVGKPHETRGKIKKVDADKGILTVTVGAGGQAKDVDFKISEGTMVAAGPKGPLAGGLKSKQVKEGAEVSIFADEEGKVLAVMLTGILDGGEKPGVPHEVKGVIKKIDADKGVLTVTVGSGDQAKDKEFKIAGAIGVYGIDKQPLKGGLKNDQVKVGVEVTLFADESGNVRGMMLGKQAKEKDKEKEKDEKEKK
jgi:transcription antitermination factor NusG